MYQMHKEYEDCWPPNISMSHSDKD
jgi:hypothetical protein